MAQLPEGFLDVFGVAALPSTHPRAVVERGGKAIHNTIEQGFLCFGQYKTGYPMIPLQAVFSVLIDNNSMDDRNILIIDVYDHHIDRVVGKRVITRKDFEKANDFCLFTFDFTPQSPQANMEFRIYYMGYAYVLADKIAVIDPAKISLTSSSQIPAVEVPDDQPPVVDPEQPIKDIPAPWQTTVIGNVKHPGEAKSKGDAFLVSVSGRDIGLKDDNFRFVYQDVKGNGTIIARVTSMDHPSDDAKAGPMIRAALDPDSPFVMMEIRPGNGTGFFYRLLKGSRTRDQGEEKNFPPYWFKLEREGSHIRGFLSEDGKTWRSIGRKEIPVDDVAYWGFALTSHNDNVLCNAVFDHVQIIQQ